MATYCDLNVSPKIHLLEINPQIHAFGSIKMQLEFDDVGEVGPMRVALVTLHEEAESPEQTPLLSSRY